MSDLPTTDFAQSSSSSSVPSTSHPSTSTTHRSGAPSLQSVKQGGDPEEAALRALSAGTHDHETHTPPQYNISRPLANRRRQRNAFQINENAGGVKPLIDPMSKMTTTRSTGANRQLAGGSGWYNIVTQNNAITNNEVGDQQSLSVPYHSGAFASSAADLDPEKKKSEQILDEMSRKRRAGQYKAQRQLQEKYERYDLGDYIPDMPVSMTTYFKQDPPHGPLDTSMLEQATAQILDTPYFERLLYNNSLMHYLEGLARIGPYRDLASDREAIGTLLDVWNVRRTDYAVNQGERDSMSGFYLMETDPYVDELRRWKERLDREHRDRLDNKEYASRYQEICQDVQSALDRRCPKPDRTRHTGWSSSGYSTDAEADTATSDRKYRDSAWMMIEDAPSRLLAAARYIGSFPPAGWASSDSPSLTKEPALTVVAKEDAMKMLYYGASQPRIEAAKTFLQALAHRQLVEDLERESVEYVVVNDANRIGSGETSSSSSDEGVKSRETDHVNDTSAEMESGSKDRSGTDQYQLTCEECTSQANNEDQAGIEVQYEKNDDNDTLYDGDEDEYDEVEYCELTQADLKDMPDMAHLSIKT